MTQEFGRHGLCRIELRLHHPRGKQCENEREYDTASDLGTAYMGEPLVFYVF